jgi:hypothetical protein
MHLMPLRDHVTVDSGESDAPLASFPMVDSQGGQTTRERHERVERIKAGGCAVAPFLVSCLVSFFRDHKSAVEGVIQGRRVSQVSRSYPITRGMKTSRRGRWLLSGLRNQARVKDPELLQNTIRS